MVSFWKLHSISSVYSECSCIVQHSQTCSLHNFTRIREMYLYEPPCKLSLTSVEGSCVVFAGNSLVNNRCVCLQSSRRRSSCSTIEAMAKFTSPKSGTLSGPSDRTPQSRTWKSTPTSTNRTRGCHSKCSYPFIRWAMPFGTPRTPLTWIHFYSKYPNREVQTPPRTLSKVYAISTKMAMVILVRRNCVTF